MATIATVLALFGVGCASAPTAVQVSNTMGRSLTELDRVWAPAFAAALAQAESDHPGDAVAQDKEANWAIETNSAIDRLRVASNLLRMGAEGGEPGLVQVGAACAAEAADYASKISHGPVADILAAIADAAKPFGGVCTWPKQ